MSSIAQARPKPKYRVCPKCDGEGVIVNPVLSVWTQDDIADDPESFEAMLEGRYDQTCNLCGGKRNERRREARDDVQRQELALRWGRLATVLDDLADELPAERAA